MSFLIKTKHIYLFSSTQSQSLIKQTNKWHYTSPYRICSVTNKSKVGILNLKYKKEIHTTKVGFHYVNIYYSMM